MSRKKKARSAGNADVIVVRQRSESDVDGRLRKKLKKRKGLKAGARHSAATEMEKRAASGQRDPRLGSKKKIPLIVEAKKPQTHEQKLHSAEQELAQIENDAQFNVLLARLDNGEKLGAGLQSYVDQRLDRIEALMSILGIDTDDFEDEEDFEDVVESEPVKAKKEPKKVRDDESLLSDFEGMNLDEWKG